MGLLSALPGMALTVAGVATGNPLLIAAGQGLGAATNRQPGQGLLSSLAPVAGQQVAQFGLNKAFGAPDTGGIQGVPRRTGIFFGPEQQSRFGAVTPRQPIFDPGSQRFSVRPNYQTFSPLQLGSPSVPGGLFSGGSSF